MTAILDRSIWTAFGRALDVPILIRIFASLVLSAVVAASTALAPLFLAKLVDGLSAREVSAGVIGLAAAYLAALCVGRLAGHVQSFHYAASDQALQRRVSELTFDQLIRLPMTFHLGANPGALIQIHSHALQGIRMVLSLACASLFPIIVQMAVILWIVGSHFDLKIWFVVCLTIAAYIGVFVWAVQRTNSTINQALQRQVDTSGLLSEGLTNVETIKNCTAEQRVGRGFAQASREVEKGWRTAFLRRLETGMAAAAVFILSMACAVWLGLEGVRSGQMSAGDFLLLTTYMVQIIGPLEMTGYAVRDLTQGAAYLSSWTGLFAERTEQTLEDTVAHAVARPRGAPPAITLDNVSLTYDGGRKVLDAVAFSIAPGTALAIVGATGEGKTSLLRVLQRHVSPDSGSVQIGNASLADIELPALRRRIAVVSQEVVLFNASLRYNLLLANPMATEDDILRVLRVTRLDQMVAGLAEGLDTIVGDRGFKLSGGERQRVAIARALLRDGDILLLDEITSALDVATEKALCADLTSMAIDRTTVIVTHRLALAAIAARIVVLHKGRVIEQGAHHQLIAARGFYYRLWSTQPVRES